MRIFQVCGVSGAGQLKLVLPPDPKQRVAFMSLQSKGLWNMSPSSKQHVRMMQAKGKDKCKPQVPRSTEHYGNFQASGVGGNSQLKLELPPDPKLTDGSRQRAWN